MLSTGVSVWWMLTDVAVLFRGEFRIWAGAVCSCRATRQVHDDGGSVVPICWSACVAPL